MVARWDSGDTTSLFSPARWTIAYGMAPTRRSYYKIPFFYVHSPLTLLLSSVHSQKTIQESSTMQSKMKLLFISLFIKTALAFPWLRPDADLFDTRRGMEAIRNDPETSQLIRDLWDQQQKEKRAFFENRGTEACDEVDAPHLGKRATPPNCMPHPLQDFLPTNITGLKRFPEAEYPYKDPRPSDQRGPCPGLNTLANHVCITLPKRQISSPH